MEGVERARTIRETARDIPVIADADVCVLGGSCTGLFAAVRAARLGARVALVEGQNRFGGVATSSLVNVWHSLYDEARERKIIAGLTEEVIERLDRRGAVRRAEDNPHAAFVFNSAELAIELDRIVAEEQVEPFLSTTFSAPIVRNGQLGAVAVEDKSGRGAIRARFFVDATGDGDLCHRLGLPTYASPRCQPPTMCAHLVGWGSVRDADLDRVLAEHRDEYDLPGGFRWGAYVPGTEVYMLAGTRVFGVDCSEARDLTRAEAEGRRQVRAILDILNRYVPGAHVSLVALPSRIGVRETRHVRCQYQLSDDDVLYGRRFADAIANGSYRVDVHHHDGAGITFKYLDGRQVVVRENDRERQEGWWRPATKENPTFYQIPLRSLIPGRYGNLIAAGRMLDAEPEAFAAVRVMVNMNQTGEAAGVAAVQSLDRGVPITDVSAADVRGLLARGGSLIL